jgi:hypothetical protein
MKKILPLLFLLVAPAFGQMGFSVLVKQHDARENFEERPYGKDDLSYGIFLEAFEGIGGWKIGAMYADDVSGIEGVDSVITPELSLMVVDRIWETGLSVLIDYVDADGEADWGDFYFQTQLGVNIPLGDRIQLGAHAFYPMESIGDIVDIGFNDLDYAVQVRVMF